MVKYLKAAFSVPWNMLAFFGAMGFAALSGRPDVAVPLVLAGEAAYVGMLAANGRFQAYVDAHDAKVVRDARANQSGAALQRIMKSLPESARRRYAELVQGCRQLRQIALDLKHSGASDPAGTLDSMQSEGLDRLLWIYLRLLFTEYSLERFLKQTPRKSIADDAKRIEIRIAEIGAADSREHVSKMRRTLEDSLATVRERLENYDRAYSNYEFVQLEIERLDNKIRSLAELAINRKEPDFISTQIDQVAHSMRDTERTMNELSYITGLDDAQDAAPPMLQSALRGRG